MKLLHLFESKQKKWFRSKLDGVQKTIWDLEFKRFKTREIREEVRQEYDNARQQISSLDEQIKIAPDEAAKQQLETQKGDAESNANRYMAQMRMLDAEVGGSGVTEEYPDGVQGINQQLEALHELEQMIREYLKVI